MILARYRLSHTVSATKLRRAIEKSLAILGTGTIQAITEDLGRHGIDLDSQAASYSLHEVEGKLNIIFGKEIGTMMFDRIRKQLNRD